MIKYKSLNNLSIVCFPNYLGICFEKQNPSIRNMPNTVRRCQFICLYRMCFHLALIYLLVVSIIF